MRTPSAATAARATTVRKSVRFISLPPNSVKQAARTPMTKRCDPRPLPPFSAAQSLSAPAAGASRCSVGWKLVRPEFRPDLSNPVVRFPTERSGDAHVVVAPVLEHLPHLDR